jgi:hypothetical protein
MAVIMTRLVCATAFVLTFSMSSAQGDRTENPWAELHRPLDLPRLDRGERCPVSAVDSRVDWPSANIFGGSGIGRGPVYPGLGSSGGHLRARPESLDGSWYAEKVFWYVRPSYRDRVLIRGRRIDGSDPLRFVDDGRRARELRIRRNPEISWPGQPEGSRGEPSGVRFQATGCYAVQIDGTTFSRSVVFRASTP